MSGQSGFLAGPPAKRGRLLGQPWGAYVAIVVITALVLIGFSLPQRHGAAIFPVTQLNAPLQAQRQLRFVELPGDDLAVIDAANGRRIEFIPEARNGFVHAVVHGLQVSRRRAGVPLDRPYILSLYRDGRLVLSDAPTGTMIDVEGFGPTNMAGVLAFLAPEDDGT
jgi:putative photosynthetic complex assembly protein